MLHYNTLPNKGKHACCQPPPLSPANDIPGTSAASVASSEEWGLSSFQGWEKWWKWIGGLRGTGPACAGDRFELVLLIYISFHTPWECVRCFWAQRVWKPRTSKGARAFISAIFDWGLTSVQGETKAVVATRKRTGRSLSLLPFKRGLIKVLLVVASRTVHFKSVHEILIVLSVDFCSWTGFKFPLFWYTLKVLLWAKKVQTFFSLMTNSVVTSMAIFPHGS